LTLGVDPRVELVGRARNGKEAVSMALELEPDAVLMDLEMPLLDGVGATHQIRDALPECEVVFLTASAVAENADRARSAGAAAYLTKDCSMRDVIDTLLEVALPGDDERKEEADTKRRTWAPRAAGRSRPLLQYGAMSTH
jgi:DNA-binding NarL/FixJ family response regulator